MGGTAEPEPEALRIETSAVFLPEHSKVRRLPRAPNRKRDADFFQRFEDRALFYDCFASGNDQITLIGPPPMNLAPDFQTAQWLALPSGQPVAARYLPSRSTMVTTLDAVPHGTDTVQLSLGGHRFEIAVQPDITEHFIGAKVMFTMNKDNPLDWIWRWADWHVALHDVDTIVIFENGSTRYDISVLQSHLASVPGLKKLAVIAFPHRYGPVDRAVLFHPYWANFLQVASFSLMTRRLAPKARGLLNCDVDELVGQGSQGGVFDTLEKSPSGFVRLKGKWIEPARDTSDSDAPDHLAFRHTHINPLRAVCANKWALDPGRDWVHGQKTFPMMHRIYGMDKTLLRDVPELAFWHFKAINTNWKQQRSAPAARVKPYHRREGALEDAIATYCKARPEAFGETRSEKS